MCVLAAAAAPASLILWVGKIYRSRTPYPGWWEFIFQAMGCIVKCGHLCDGRRSVRFGLEVKWVDSRWFTSFEVSDRGPIDVTGLLRTMLNEPTEDGTIDSLSDRLTELTVLTDHRLTFGQAKMRSRCATYFRTVNKPLTQLFALSMAFCCDRRVQYFRQCLRFA